MTRRTVKSQRGVTTLMVAIVLLVGLTLVVLFANRSIVFEQRTSANQYRSTKALQAAEAGLEWSLAQLNTPLNLGAACTTTGGTRTFRDNYLNPAAADPPAYATASGAFSGARPACVRLSGRGWSCGCPVGTSTTVAAPACDDATGACARFEVRFERVQDPLLAATCATSATNCVTSAVKVTSTGYTDATATPDGTATVSQLLRTLSGLASPPAAPLTAKSTVDLGGNVNVTNTDPATNGITINAGGAVTLGGSSSVTTVPGTPPDASIAGNDSSLSAMTDDQMFQTFFGMSKSAFMSMPSTTQIPAVQPACAATFSCTTTYGASDLAAVIAAGANIIWVNGALDLSGNGTFGSPTRPVVIVVTGNIHVNGTVGIFGVMYSQAAVWDNTGGGNASICGAAIAEGAFTANGTPNPTYPSPGSACANIFTNLRKATGTFAKVPGSWRDF